jgi:hypothetical protein
MRGVLFVGPSLDPEQAACAFPGEIQPPIKRGDIDELMARPQRPEVIGIVDGQFLHTFQISPKEVLRALDRGVQVYGASSMGALRAAECVPFGMIGVGRIFEMYRSGEIDADDEVAITFDGDSQRALSEPMVNIRIALQAAVDAAVVGQATADHVTAVAKSLYFPDRSYARVMHEVRGQLGAAEHAALAAYLLGGSAPDQKRTDALELIEMMIAATTPSPLELAGGATR